jgi:hypothetical protein
LPKNLKAVTLAYSGRGDEALAEARRAMALYRVHRSRNRGYDQLQLVRICIVAGKTEQALDELERLFEQPTYVTRKWLTVDPLFDSLRGNPRFERMVAAG